jgi:CRISPR type IV-associated protein Csf3
MKPMKITAHMQDGRIATTDGYLPLDSILAAEWMRRNHPDAYYNASSHMLTNELIEAELPFERRGAGESWYWACSFNAIPSSHEYVMHWHKRFDDQLEQYIDFQGRRGKVDVKSSRHKAYRMPLVVRLFERLEWYAVGDADAVRDLCSGVTHIGKKTSQGLGAVDWWEVEPWPEDRSVWGPDGRLMRAIPMDSALESRDAVRVERYGIRPPYWWNDHQRVCFMPC